MTNKEIVKEFLGKIIRAVGKKKGQAAAKQLLQSPEMKKLAAQSAKIANDVRNDMEKKAAGGDDVANATLDILKKMGY
jgi:hypothetical protein